MARLRIGDVVKRRGVPGQQRGRVVGFADGGGGRLILVEWVDKRIFPNPSPEPEGGLERVHSDSTR